MPNSFVIAADTSSAAGAAIDVVDDDAADVASLIASPIPLKSDDAVAKASGAAIRKDDILGSDHRRARQTRRSSRQAQKTVRAAECYFRRFSDAFVHVDSTEGSTGRPLVAYRVLPQVKPTLSFSIIRPARPRAVSLYESIRIDDR